MTLTKSDKFVDNSAKSSIINNIKPKQGVKAVHYIGKIDKNIYKCVTDGRTKLLLQIHKFIILKTDTQMIMSFSINTSMI